MSKQALPPRAAAIVRWHAATTTAALAAMVVGVVTAPRVSIPSLDTPLISHGFRAIHLSFAAPLWLLAAWQLAQLRRLVSPAPGRAWRIAAVAALVAAAACAGSEVCIPMLARPSHGPALDWVAMLGAAAAAAATAWMIATCLALAGAALGLAAGTLRLPTVRWRERALYLAAALRALPWSFVLAVIAGTTLHPVLGLALAAAGALALTLGALALASLLARSRELAEATTR